MPPPYSSHDALQTRDDAPKLLNDRPYNIPRFGDFGDYRWYTRDYHVTETIGYSKLGRYEYRNTSPGSHATLK